MNVSSLGRQVIFEAKQTIVCKGPKVGTLKINMVYLEQTSVLGRMMGSRVGRQRPNS